METHKTCSVFGHSRIKITSELIDKLSILFEHLIIKRIVKYFYFVGLGEFDNCCWEIITKLRHKYPQIQRIFLVPDPRWINLNKRLKWLKQDDYEEIVYLDIKFDYWYTRIHYRNCEIINHSDFIVFYVNHSEKSGVYKAMQYAIKNKKEIINVCCYKKS